MLATGVSTQNCSTIKKVILNSQCRYRRLTFNSRKKITIVDKNDLLKRVVENRIKGVLRYLKVCYISSYKT